MYCVWSAVHVSQWSALEDSHETKHSFHASSDTEHVHVCILRMCFVFRYSSKYGVSVRTHVCEGMHVIGG